MIHAILRPVVLCHTLGILHCDVTMIMTPLGEGGSPDSNLMGPPLYKKGNIDGISIMWNKTPYWFSIKLALKMQRYQTGDVAQQYNAYLVCMML